MTKFNLPSLSFSLICFDSAKNGEDKFVGFGVVCYEKIWKCKVKKVTGPILKICGILEMFPCDREPIILSKI